MSKFFLFPLCVLFCFRVSASEQSDSLPLGSPHNEGIENTLPAEDIEEVLVTGEQPGPGLWKIYKGEHVLWILGTISPLPKNMQWHSKKVDAAVAESQEFIKPPEVALHVSFFGGLSILPSLIGIKNNPDGQKLKDVLPAELYTRWQLLKEKYMAKNKDVEKQRPIFAATDLFNNSIEKSGLVPNDSVRWAIEAIVKNNKIKTTIPTIQQELKSPHATVKKFKKSTLDDTECFAKTLERLETDLDAMRARANAWSKGDVNLLRSLPYPDEKAACEQAVLNSELAQDQGMQDIKQQLQTIWLQTVEAALTNNQSTFTMLPMADLLRPDGFIAQLKAKGYEIDAPE